VLAVGKGREAHIFRCVYGAADVTDPHRSAVLVGDDDVVPGRGIQHLAVVVNCEGPGLPVAGSLRADGGCVNDHPTQSSSERPNDLHLIDLDAHRWLLLAGDLHVGNAGNLADVLV
jgi:hypothetical protein